MTAVEPGDVEGESVTRAYYDIAQLLESGDDAKARVIRVLERLRSLVPYERCAVLETAREGEARLITVPETTEAEQAELTVTIGALLEPSVVHGEPGADATRPRLHLAVPLVGLDGVLGFLCVYSAETAYQERHVRALSVVAAKLAAYFSLLRALAVATERTRQLEEACAAAESADRAKDEFLSLVSHELRTPLNSILASTDALRSRTTGEAERARAVDDIERSVRAQTRLISDLLDLSCVAAATLRLDLCAVDPSQVIRAAVRTLQSRVTQKAIRLDVVLDESVTPLIADPGRLNQIVANLVANAIKFSPHGGQVEIRLDRVGILARIRVIDAGCGMTPEVLSRLFEPFKQVDSSSTRPQGGMGIGLALVKDLVELHGGQIRGESPGAERGATFTVELPLVGAVQTASAQPETAALERPEERGLAGVRVLVVDDDRDTAEVFQFVLEAQGAIVTVAVSAAEALAALARSMPDVLLSDIAMPGQSGYDSMRAIESREGVRLPAAAALSAHARGQSLQEVFTSGFRMLLEKPIDAQALVSAVAALAALPRPGSEQGLP